MNDLLILAPIAVPLIAGLVILPFFRGSSTALGLAALAAAALNLAAAIALVGTELSYSLPLTSFGFSFDLRLYHFSGFIIVAAGGFALLIGLYAIAFMHGRPRLNQFYAYFLLTLGLVNGAVLADNLLLFIFFWEGLLVTLFGMIAIGEEGAWRAATKAFIIVGASDLCLMLGIALTGHLAGTLGMSHIRVPAEGWGALAFLLLATGAVAKAGAMPFHSWIPNAADAAPLPFMAILPASLEKLLGIYFLARICLDFFALTPGSWLSYCLMGLGSLTIIAAVLMALIQREYKRLLSYHAISQVGYMILGIGTAVPLGIMGGLFHMINHAVYKSCLFLTGGSVERQTGATHLESLGGLVRKMPVTFTCFLVAAASISGVPPFNGFFSKELVYEAALGQGVVFYIIAVLGSFFTAASFLKLGHASYFGPLAEHNRSVREAPLPMLIPMIALALVCVVFGLWHTIPLGSIIAPIIPGGDRTLADLHLDYFLLAMTAVVLVGAALNHAAGVRLTGKGISSVDHVHDTPGFLWLYDQTQKRLFDPYRIGKIIIRYGSRALWQVDRAIDWCSMRGIVTLVRGAGRIRELQTGNLSTYIALSLMGAIALLVYYVIQ